MKLTISIISVILTSISCSTSPIRQARGPARQPTSSTTDGTIEAQLAELLQPYVKELERDIWTFRYEHDDNGSSPQSLSELRDHEERWAERFFDADRVTGDDVGPGLFVATDPNATATWGLSSPHLIALKIRARTRIVSGDLPAMSANELSRAQILLDGMSCQSVEDRRDRPIDGAGTLIGALRNSKQFNCRHLVTSALANLSVQGILYSFNSVTLKGCRMTGTAVNIIDPRSIDFDYLNYYSESRKMESKPEISPFIQALFEEGKNDYRAQALLNSRALLFKYRQGFGFFTGTPNAEPAAYESWKANSILKCGTPLAVEIPSGLAALRSNIAENADAETTSLMIDAALAYQAKAGISQSGSYPADFSADRLRVFLKRQFAGSGLSQTNQSYARWRSLTQQALSTNSLASFAKAYNERVPLQSLGDTLKAVYRVALETPVGQRNKSQLLGVAFKKAGLGPQSSRLLANVFQLVYGGTPYLVGQIPSDFNRDESSAIATNIRLVRQILHKCLKIYQNPRISMQEIDQGSCAIESNR